MNNTVVSETENLIKLQKKLRLKSLIYGLLLAFIPLFLLFIYVLFYALGHTYAPFFSKVSVKAFAFFAYFDTSKNMFDFSVVTNIYRFILLLVCIGLGVVIFFLFNYFYTKKISKLYEMKYYDSIVSENKLNGLILNKLEVTPSLITDNEKVFEDICEYEPKFLLGYELSTSLALLKLYQYSYISQENESRDGLLIETSLSFIRSHAFIQIRSSGKPSFTTYNGLDVHCYGFDDVCKLTGFVCYTTLEQEIYLIIDKKVTSSLEKLSLYVKTDIVLQVKEDKLYIFLEGFKLDFIKPYKEKLLPQTLEKQVEAFIGLEQLIYKLVNALNGEVQILPPSKGNGITLE